MAKIKIGGRFYDCEIVNGERIIEGKTVDEFIDTLSREQLSDCLNVGINVIKGNDNSPQKMFNEEHQKREN